MEFICIPVVTETKHLFICFKRHTFLCTFFYKSVHNLQEHRLILVQARVNLPFHSQKTFVHPPVNLERTFHWEFHIYCRGIHTCHSLLRRSSLLFLGGTTNKYHLNIASVKWFPELELNYWLSTLATDSLGPKRQIKWCFPNSLNIANALPWKDGEGPLEESSQTRDVERGCTGHGGATLTMCHVVLSETRSCFGVWHSLESMTLPQTQMLGS